MQYLNPQELYHYLLFLDIWMARRDAGLIGQCKECRDVWKETTLRDMTAVFSCMKPLLFGCNHLSKVHGVKTQPHATRIKAIKISQVAASSYGQATDIDFSITPRLGWRSSVSRHHGACSRGFNLNLTIISNYQGAILPLTPQPASAPCCTS